MAQNYLNAFRAPDLAGIDRAAYGNALMRNDVQRLPQRNAAEDFDIRANQDVHNQNMSEAQKANAQGVLGRGFAMIANSPNTKGAARAFLSSQDFQAAGKLLGLPLDQFTVADTDDDNALRQQATAWAQALGAGGASNQIGVQSTQVLADGTIATVMDDGRIIRTNERARTPREPAEQVVQTMGPNGQPIYAPISQAPGKAAYVAPTAPRPPTEGDKRNGLMFDSMVNAEQQIADMTAAGNSTDTSSKWDALLGLSGLSVAQSDAYKQYEAAGLRWAANSLYMKSGATATPEEIRSTWKQYFPQPGDGPEVIKQKNAARVQEMLSAGDAVGGQVPPQLIDRVNQPTNAGGSVAPDGTVIENEAGERMIKRNNRWEPL